MGKGKKITFLGKNIGLFAISSFGSRIISFLLVPLYTSALSTEDYGTVDLIATTALLLIPIFTLEIQDAVLRYALDSRDKKQVISIGFQITIIGSSIISVILILGNIILRNRYDWILVWFLIISCFLGALNNVFTMYLKGIDKVADVVVSGLINTGVLCLCNILLLVVFPLGMYCYLVAYSAGLLLSCGYQFIKGGIYKSIEKIHDYELKNEMLTYSKPLIANQLSWWINNASDRYILTFLKGITENGIYSVSYKVPTILSTLQSIFFNAWSISAIKDYDKEDNDGFFGEMYETYSLLSILSCSVILVLNQSIASLLYKKDFFFAWHYVPFLLVGTVFNGLAMFLGAIFTATKQSQIISKTTIIGAAVNTIGNIPLIYFFGGYGAAVSTFLGYLVMWMLRLNRIKENINIDVRWLIHYSSLAIIIIQAFVAMFGTLIQVQIALCILIIGINRNLIKTVLSQIINKIKEKHG